MMRLNWRFLYFRLQQIYPRNMYSDAETMFLSRHNLVIWGIQFWMARVCSPGGYGPFWDILEPSLESHSPSSLANSWICTYRGLDILSPMPSTNLC